MEVTNNCYRSEGALAYFSAARLANFHEIILLRVDRNCGQMMKVSEAKTTYIDFGFRFPYFRGIWYFCSPMPSKLQTYERTDVPLTKVKTCQLTKNHKEYTIKKHAATEKEGHYFFFTFV